MEHNQATRKELAALVADTAGCTKLQAEACIKALVSGVCDLLASGKEVALHGLGKFTVVELGERKARNPQTGETLTVPAGKTVRFKISDKVKNSVKD